MSLSRRNQPMNNLLFSLCRIVCITGFLAVFSAKAKDDTYKDEFVNRRTFGFCLQQGIPFYRFPEGRSYKPTGLMGVYHQPFFKAKRLVNVAIDLMPQLWFSKAKIAGIEIGLNTTLNLNIQIKRNSILSFHLGSGVHFFGMDTERQAQGFIFSDNVLISYKHQITLKNYKRIDIGCITGFRHLSNLGTQKPNHGIDNIIVGICFDRVF